MDIEERVARLEQIVDEMNQEIKDFAQKMLTVIDMLSMPPPSQRVRKGPNGDPPTA